MDIAGFPVTFVQVAVFLFVSAGVGSVLMAFQVTRSGASRLDDRLKWVSDASDKARVIAASGDEARRRLVQDAVRELEARAKARTRPNARPTLRGRMRQAGLAWTRYTYLSVSAAAGAIGYLVAISGFGHGLLTSLCIGAASGLLLPHLFVEHKRKRRMKAFSEEFPNALDTVVRGVQAGLALIDCLNIIATESSEPVRGEFATIVQDLKLGVPLDESMERMAVRVPLSEANFFSIVIAIQSRTGGNLAEALTNLSKVLRDRKAIRAKIKALSAEAKTSAMIIGAMPLFVASGLYLTSPDYVSLLFTTETGNTALFASAILMGLGTMLMRKMINFDF